MLEKISPIYLKFISVRCALCNHLLLSIDLVFHTRIHPLSCEDLQSTTNAAASRFLIHTAQTVASKLTACTLTWCYYGPISTLVVAVAGSTLRIIRPTTIDGVDSQWQTSRNVTDIKGASEGVCRIGASLVFLYHSSTR